LDNRLFKIETRPGPQLQQDLPLLARALVAVFRKKGHAKVGRTKNIDWVRLETSEYHVQVLASDWAKILPFIKDETFNQAIVKSQIDSVWIDPLTSHAPPLIDRTDRQYYLRVLGILQGLFPTGYPTSSL
jgi:hypothetical protein